MWRHSLQSSGDEERTDFLNFLKTSRGKIRRKKIVSLKQDVVGWIVEPKKIMPASQALEWCECYLI